MKKTIDDVIRIYSDNIYDIALDKSQAEINLDILNKLQEMKAASSLGLPPEDGKIYVMRNRQWLAVNITTNEDPE